MVHSHSFVSAKDSNWGMQKFMASREVHEVVRLGESHLVLTLLLFDAIERYEVVGHL